jgi:hypothetical protein
MTAPAEEYSDLEYATRLDGSVMPAPDVHPGVHCWCGGEVGARVPGDHLGLGCLANITHRWSDYKCDGSHSSRRMENVGPLEVEICSDPQCAKVSARCTHLEITGPSKLSPLLVETKSICKWNEDGTVLTCTFCGVDGT